VINASLSHDVASGPHVATKSNDVAAMIRFRRDGPLVRPAVSIPTATCFNTVGQEKARSRSSAPNSSVETGVYSGHQRLDMLPIDKIVEEGFEVLRPRIAVVDIVAVFPHIAAKNRRCPMHQRVFTVRSF